MPSVGSGSGNRARVDHWLQQMGWPVTPTTANRSSAKSISSCHFWISQPSITSPPCTAAGWGNFWSRLTAFTTQSGQTTTPNKLTEIFNTSLEPINPRWQKVGAFGSNLPNKSATTHPPSSSMATKPKMSPLLTNAISLLTFARPLKIKGSPIRLEFKTSDNPYKDRKNELSPKTNCKAESV